jgi:hypothetical protein
LTSRRPASRRASCAHRLMTDRRSASFSPSR